MARKWLFGCFGQCRLYSNYQLCHCVKLVMLILFCSKVISANDVYDFTELFEKELYFEVLYPEEIHYTFKIKNANDFGTRFNETITSIPLVPAQPLLLCSPAVNHLQLKGSVALAQRGDCSFVTKTINAENSGARAVIIMDSDADNDVEIIYMQDDETGRSTYIPSVSIYGKDGHVILRTLAQLQLDYAVINISVNLTGVPLHKRNFPKWNVW